MTILPLDPRQNSSEEALRSFLGRCQTVAIEKAHPQLVSISLEVDALDPLAVLESIFEPHERHFYVERPAEGLAIAGAEAVLSFTAGGENRFAAVQSFIDDTLAHTLAVGDLSVPFAGPHFFQAYSFFNDVEAGEPFAAASVFVPRWQAACRDGRTVAVANLLVDAQTQIEALAHRVWRARQKFAAFDYATPPVFVAKDSSLVEVREVGLEGAYQAAVAKAVQSIKAGEFQKVVLARAKDFNAASSFHPLKMLNGLRQRYADCYAFSLANGRGQSLIGASPEQLLQLKGHTLFTEALAGSARRGSSASEDAAIGNSLLRSEKDLAEHEYVVRAIERRLAPLGIKMEFPPRPALKKLANVQHLHTPMKGALPDGVRLIEALARLHPTPAVGGSPREKAIPCIRKLETFPRGLYAGALGWTDGKGEGVFFVGLRSALVDGKNARLYAGAGIVAGSDPAGELAETELKFRALAEAISS